MITDFFNTVLFFGKGWLSCDFADHWTSHARNFRAFGRKDYVVTAWSDTASIFQRFLVEVNALSFDALGLLNALIKILIKSLSLREFPFLGRNSQNSAMISWTVEIHQSLAISLLESLGTPHSLSLWYLLKKSLEILKIVFWWGYWLWSISLLLNNLFWLDEHRGVIPRWLDFDPVLPVLEKTVVLVETSLEWFNFRDFPRLLSAVVSSVHAA